MQFKLPLKFPLRFFQVFNANENETAIVYHTINPIIFTRYIRILPQTWHSRVSMRVEFYECDGNLYPVHTSAIDLKNASLFTSVFPNVHS